jgi:hypothetical protein
MFMICANSSHNYSSAISLKLDNAYTTQSVCSNM